MKIKFVLIKENGFYELIITTNEEKSRSICVKYYNDREEAIVYVFDNINSLEDNFIEVT